jgi:hypothetical protein
VKLRKFPVSLDGDVNLPLGADVLEVHYENTLGVNGPPRAYEVLALVPDTPPLPPPGP